MGITLKVDFNHLDKVLADVLAATDRTLHAHAEKVADEARGRVHVKTGATRASIYVSSPTGSNYSDAAGEAAGLNPKAHILPEEPHGEHGAVVGVADADGVYEEYGTAHMPAHPFMGPASDAHVNELERALADALGALS